MNNTMNIISMVNTAAAQQVSVNGSGNMIGNLVTAAIGNSLTFEVENQINRDVQTIKNNQLPYQKASPKIIKKPAVSLEIKLLSHFASYLHFLLLMLLNMSAIIIVYSGYKRRKKELKELSFQLRTALESISGFTYLLSKSKTADMASDENKFIHDIASGTNVLISELKRMETKDGFDLKMGFNVRTALQDIMGFSEILSKTKSGRMTNMQKEFLEGILKGARDVLKLIPYK